MYFFFFTFPCGILGQVWYLIVSFPDLCSLSYLDTSLTTNNKNNSVEMLAISLKTVILRYIFPSTIVRKINNNKIMIIFCVSETQQRAMLSNLREINRRQEDQMNKLLEENNALKETVYKLNIPATVEETLIPNGKYI